MNPKIKVFYFTQVDIFGYEKDSGVTKKILGHKKALERADIECEIVACPRPNRTKKYRILNRLPFFPIISKYKWENRYKNADAYIIRLFHVDRFIIKFLKRIRENNDKAKIIIDFPDFPIGSDQYRLDRLPFILKNNLNAYKLKKYADRASDVWGNKNIYGIPCLQCFNGTDIETITPKLIARKENQNEINILALTTCLDHPAYGYDRIIKGISNYIKLGEDKCIKIHFGGYDYSHRLHHLVKELGIEEYVIFHGFLSGDDLESLYNLCDFGVETLSRIKGSKTNDTGLLKVGEYLAKGLPYITCANLKQPYDILADKYILKVDEGEGALEIKKILPFWSNINNNIPQEIAIDEMRRFSYEFIDISIAFKAVVNYIKE